MEACSILIALNNENQIKTIKSILIETGCRMVYVAKDSNDCLRKARQLRPEIVIVDSDISQQQGFEIAKVVVEDGVSSVILIANGSQHFLFSESKKYSDMNCLTRPISKGILTNSIEIILKNRKKIRLMQEEIESLKSSLEARKFVEKAKGILMEEKQLSENQALREMQKRSMDLGKPMIDIAKEIVNKVI